MPYPTPANPPGPLTVSRAVLLPADADYLRLVAGALLELVDASNYEQADGHETVEATVDFFLTVLSDFYE